ncbi:MAG: ribbon-helix-helix domain-containing protein [Planctomycetota bacterium]|nr:ribbon-helix-helix domain-containing protein [Planctomycetota bacterium]
MAVKKFAVSMGPELLNRLDRLVKSRVFSSRSQAVQVAVREKVERLEHSRLARECRKLDHKTEQAMAEEGLSEELTQWPEY